MRHHIRVNTVCPFFTDTPMLQASLQRVPHLGHMIQKISPVGRVASPEEVADAIIFLSSPSASFINGTSLMIDAGFTLMPPGEAVGFAPTPQGATNV
jgi:NAD(P)-dependent dehydrogenase (short-subunit alcohol dehydrogenase family)